MEVGASCLPVGLQRWDFSGAIHHAGQHWYLEGVVVFLVPQIILNYL